MSELHPNEAGDQSVNYEELLNQAKAEALERAQQDPSNPIAEFNRGQNNPQLAHERGVDRALQRFDLSDPVTGQTISVQEMKALDEAAGDLIFFPQFGIDNQDTAQQLKGQEIGRYFDGRVLLVDKPGTGLSDNLSKVQRQELSAGSYTSTAKSIDRALMIKGNAQRTIMGYSEGAAYAAAFAAERPDLVSELVLFEPVGIDDEGLKNFTQAFMAEGEHFDTYRHQPPHPDWEATIGPKKGKIQGALSGLRDITQRVKRSPAGALAEVKAMAQPTVPENLLKLYRANPNAKVTVFRGSGSQVSNPAANHALKEFLRQQGEADGIAGGYKYREIVAPGDPHGGANENLVRWKTYLSQILRRPS